HRVCGAAARGASDLRDDAERAREAAPVLDLHERAHAIEPDVGLHTAKRAGRLGNVIARTFARERDDLDVRGHAVEALLEVRRAAGHIYAGRPASCPAHCLPGLAHRFVRDAARIDDGDVDVSACLDVPTGGEALADLLRV